MTPAMTLRTPAGWLTVFLSALAALPAAGARADAPEPGGQVTATLLADTTAVKPGGEFVVGVLLEIAPGWHTYWVNPGDSGLAPRVKFQLPDGFTAGELRFPTPVKFPVEGGSGVGFGYTKEVLLTATVKAPAALKAGGEVKLAAAVNWLVCKDVCLPGEARVEAALPVSDQPAAANERLFRVWHARLPVDVADSPDVGKLEWSAGPAAGEATLTVTRKNPARDMTLFPGPDDALDVQTVSVDSEGGKTTVKVRVRLLAGQKLQGDTLPAVFGYTAKEGQRRGVRTAIPVADILGTGKPAKAANP